MSSDQEWRVVYENFIFRIDGFIRELRPLIDIDDPSTQLLHIIYQVDSLCRDILLVHGWAPLPDDFVALVTEAYRILRSAGSPDVGQGSTISEYSTISYPARDLTGAIGRPKLIITLRQLQHLLGKLHCFGVGSIQGFISSSRCGILWEADHTIWQVVLCAAYHGTGYARQVVSCI